MSERQQPKYETTKEERQALFGLLGFLAVGVLLTARNWAARFSGWDHNNDGVISISDVSALIGETLSLTWVDFYIAFRPLARFLELPLPLEATPLTASAGLVITFIVAGLAGWMIGGLTVWISGFPAHWRAHR